MDESKGSGEEDRGRVRAGSLDGEIGRLGDPGSRKEVSIPSGMGRPARAQSTEGESAGKNEHSDRWVQRWSMSKSAASSEGSLAIPGHGGRCCGASRPVHPPCH